MCTAIIRSARSLVWQQLWCTAYYIPRNNTNVHVYTRLRLLQRLYGVPARIELVCAYVKMRVRVRLAAALRGIIFPIVD